VALVELCAGLEMPDDAMDLRLLADARDAFTQEQSDRISTRQLLERLHARDDSPWNEFDHGRPLNSFRLSRLFRPFGVKPRDIRFDQGVQKGYLRADLEDPWERYLGQEGQQGQQASVHAGPGYFCEGQQVMLVADQEDAESPTKTRVVADVAPISPAWSEMGDVSRLRLGTKSNATKYCRVHPANENEWWLRGGVDLVCELCHPNPAAI
jgi:hypothetical protein